MDLQFYLILAPVILFSLTVHEYAHALAAWKLGDDTAKNMGRLSLNPLVHLDLIGTVLLFIVHFGWAKPVPVNPRNFRNPKKDMLLVAVAGPVSNVLTAVAAAVLLNAVLENFDSYAALSSQEAVFVSVRVLWWFIYIGIVLAVFNMLPIPPLDGSRVLYGLLPAGADRKYLSVEKYGILILVAVLFLGGKYVGYFLSAPVYIFITACGFDQSKLEMIARAMSGTG